MTCLLSTRNASMLLNRLHAANYQRNTIFTLPSIQCSKSYYSSPQQRNFKSANILSGSPAIQSIGQSIRTTHSFDSNKKWQIVNKQNYKQFGESVYKGKFTSQMLRVKLFSFTTSVMGAISQPILWQKGMEVSGAGLGIAMCSIVGVFTFVTPVLLHLVVKKYVIDILYNKETDEYTAITISPLMFRKTVTISINQSVKLDHIPSEAKCYSFARTGNIQGG